jgi:hypothetical protein
MQHVLFCVWTVSLMCTAMCTDMENNTRYIVYLGAWGNVVVKVLRY